MVLQTSGTISIDDLVTEFGGTAPHSLNEYYRGGGLVPDTSTNSGIPASGQIQLDDFYGGDVVSGPPSGGIYTLGMDGSYDAKFSRFDGTGAFNTGFTETNQPTNSTYYTTVPIQDSRGDTDFIDMALHGYSNLYLKNDGTIWGGGKEIGTNSWGFHQVYGPNYGITTATGTIRQVGDNNADWTDVGYQSANIAGVRSDGRAWALGHTGAYQGFGDALGLGDTSVTGPNIGGSQYTSPVQVYGSATNWKHYNAGGNGCKTDGRAYSFGPNGEDILAQQGWNGTGQSGYAGHTTPTQLYGNLTTWDYIERIALGGRALKTDGKLWGWGGNYRPYIGSAGQGVYPFNGTGQTSTPVQETSNSTWEQISGNYGLKTDGRLWAFNNNTSAQWLHGTNTFSTAGLTQVYGGATNWASMPMFIRQQQYYQAGDGNSWVKTDGRAYAWNYAQGSDNTPTQYVMNATGSRSTWAYNGAPGASTPQQVSGNYTDWIKIQGKQAQYWQGIRS